MDRRSFIKSAAAGAAVVAGAPLMAATAPANWLATSNPFSLRKPPEWWMRQLAIFDPELVIFPSIKDAKYRLARRVRNSYGLQVVGKVHNHPDTTFMAANQLVPVTSFLPTIQWTDEIFVYLRCCDMWKVGGAERAADIFEASEATARKQLDARLADDIEVQAGSAYRAAKTRLGQTVFVHR